MIYPSSNADPRDQRGGGSYDPVDPPLPTPLREIRSDWRGSGEWLSGKASSFSFLFRLPKMLKRPSPVWCRPPRSAATDALFDANSVKLCKDHNNWNPGSVSGCKTSGMVKPQKLYSFCTVSFPWTNVNRWKLKLIECISLQTGCIIHCSIL